MIISWDEMWMSVAVLVSQRSKCARAQYGAVIVSHDNRVLSVGYNGPPHGLKTAGLLCTHWCARSQRAAAGENVDGDSHYLDCPAVHAELNAIMRADGLWREPKATMYVNAVTCPRCVVTVANSGIKKIVMRNSEYELKRDPYGTMRRLQNYSIEVELLDAV